jgi:membrane protein
LLLSLLYLSMPNTRVSLRAALAAGVVAGTLFQVLQLVYIGFQVGVSRYNTIYGSFAALPLFLIWLRMSWLIVLVGAEVSFAVDNAGDYGRERAAGRANLHQRRLLAIRLAAACAGRFMRKEEPATAGALAEELGVPTRLVQGTLNTLVRAGVLAEVQSGGKKSGGFQPAVDPGLLSIVGLGEAFDRAWAEIPDEGLMEEEEVNLVPEAALGELGERWRALAAQGEKSEDNWSLDRLAESLGSARG